MGRTTVWINNFNRLTTTRALVEYLGRIPRARAAILDNASSYPPLLDWYDQAPCEVIRLDSNLGHLAPWLSGAVAGTNDDFYAVTDPDLDLSACPTDLLEVLRLGLERYPDRIKAGLGLVIADLPACYPWRDDVIRHESVFWSQPLDDRFFAASVDTTFALYRASHDYLGEGWRYDPSLRTKEPYVARHLPWYLDPFHLDGEQRYYFDHASGSSSLALRIRESADPR